MSMGRPNEELSLNTELDLTEISVCSFCKEILLFSMSIAKRESTFYE
jgi:hypothetical protein